MPASKKLFTKNHFLSALLVGALDIAAACIQYYIATGKGPEGVLRYIASGVFGDQAYKGNVAMPVWGLVFHFIAAITFSFIFFALIQKFPGLLQQKILLALIYAVLMWASMRFIVMPLSMILPPPVLLRNAVIAISILIVCISTPLVIVATKEGERF